MTPEQIAMRHEAPDEFARWLTEQTLASDRVYKIEITANGPEDMPNRLMYLATDEDTMNLIMPAALGPVQITPAEEIAMCCRMARERFGEPFLIGFMAEAYVQNFQPGQEENAPRQRGVLAERFKRGDANVTECMTIYVMHRRMLGTLRSLAVTLPFHYADGSVVFGEPSWVDSLDPEITGEVGTIPEALAAAFGSEQN